MIPGPRITVAGNNGEAKQMFTSHPLAPRAHLFSLLTSVEALDRNVYQNLDPCQIYGLFFLKRIQQVFVGVT